MVPITFSSHSENCVICAEQALGTKTIPRGRPLKRNIGQETFIHKQFKKTASTSSTKKTASTSSTKYCHHKSVDTDCIFCIAQLFGDLMKVSSKNTIESALSVFVTSLSKDNLPALAYEVGKAESSTIRSDSVSFNDMYTRILKQSQSFMLLTG